MNFKAVLALPICISLAQRWIYYYGKETGKTHLCVMVVFDWKVREVWEVKEVFGVTEGLENCFAIDELWDHIQLRAVKEKAMVVCR